MIHQMVFRMYLLVLTLAEKILVLVHLMKMVIVYILES